MPIVDEFIDEKRNLPNILGCLFHTHCSRTNILSYRMDKLCVQQSWRNNQFIRFYKPAKCLSDGSIAHYLYRSAAIKHDHRAHAPFRFGIPSQKPQNHQNLEEREEDSSQSSRKEPCAHDRLTWKQLFPRQQGNCIVTVLEKTIRVARIRIPAFTIQGDFQKLDCLLRNAAPIPFCNHFYLIVQIGGHVSHLQCRHGFLLVLILHAFCMHLS